MIRVKDVEQIKTESMNEWYHYNMNQTKFCRLYSSK